MKIEYTESSETTNCGTIEGNTIFVYLYWYIRVLQAIWIDYVCKVQQNLVVDVATFCG